MSVSRRSRYQCTGRGVSQSAGILKTEMTVVLETSIPDLRHQYYFRRYLPYLFIGANLRAGAERSTAGVSRNGEQMARPWTLWRSLKLDNIVEVIDGVGPMKLVNGSIGIGAAGFPEADARV